MSRAAEVLEELGSCDVLPPIDERPVWRGWIHQVTVLAALPMLVLLALSANSTRALVAAIVYAVGFTATFGVSTLYHRLPHATPAVRSRFQRADHATIFLCIGGTCVPLCLVGVPLGWGIPLLSVVGVGVAVGITCSFIRRRWADITSGALYIVVGWIAIIAMPALIAYRGWTPAILIAIGGVLYTTGAVLFAKGVPTLSRRVFGYHEVWHTFTVLAAGCHFAAVWSLTSA